MAEAVLRSGVKLVHMTPAILVPMRPASRRKWYTSNPPPPPVVRVNMKTVTVSHWLGIATMTYKIEYTKIKDVKAKPTT